MQAGSEIVTTLTYAQKKILSEHIAEGTKGQEELRKLGCDDRMEINRMAGCRNSAHGEPMGEW